LDAASHRLQRFIDKLKDGNCSVGDYKQEMRTLREAIEDDSKTRYFIYVNKVKSKAINNIDINWKNTRAKFDSARLDIEQGVNCYASDNSTAAIFHFMRVAELGLRALAKERGVKLPNGRPIDWADWQEIIVQINKKIEELANKKRGPARASALEFYRGAMGSFESFKDVYRNNVMHSRVHYDELQAESVMRHVQEFMERLSAKIGENPKAIKWGIKK
jgi:hypothetical protein